MPTALRIATFNLENLDNKPGDSPSLSERIKVMRPQLVRLNADILCLQEVHGQEQPNKPRQLLALMDLLEGTQYSAYKVATTKTTRDEVYDVRNLVILSRFDIKQFEQYKHDYAPAPFYDKVTDTSVDDEAKKVTWERPILHAKIDIGLNKPLHMINLHLKSRNPSSIPNQQQSRYIWKTASGWAEGFFVSSMKRVGQALETRMLIDSIFNEDEHALIAVCGDFNCETDEVPMEAIRGDVENTGNINLVNRIMIPCEKSVPESSRYSYIHQGQKRLLDHVLVSRALLPYYHGTVIHNEVLHDESKAFTSDKLFPESDHAPVLAEFLIANT